MADPAPLLRERPPPKLPPCPQCGGTVVQVAVARRLETFCTECEWDADPPAAPDR